MLRMILLILTSTTFVVACGGSNSKAPINKNLKSANDPGVRDQKFNKIMAAPCIDLPAVEAQLLGLSETFTAYTVGLDLKSGTSDKATSLSDDTIRAKILLGEQKARTTEDEFDGAHLQDSPVVGSFLTAVTQDQCATVTFGKDDKTQVFKADKVQTPGSLSLTADNKERRIYTLEGSGIRGTTRHMRIRVLQPVKVSCDDGKEQAVFFDQTYIVSWAAEPFQLSRAYGQLMVQALPKGIPKELKTLLAADPNATAPTTPVTPIPGKPLPPAPAVPPSTPGLSPDMIALSKELYLKMTSVIQGATFPAPTCKTSAL